MEHPAIVSESEDNRRVSPALESLRSPKRLLIGGKWVPSKSGKSFETINPANEEALALIAEGDKADVDEAAKAARKAFEEGRWPSMRTHDTQIKSVYCRL